MKQFFNEPEIEIVTFEALDKIGAVSPLMPLAGTTTGGGSMEEGSDAMGGGETGGDNWEW